MPLIKAKDLRKIEYPQPPLPVINRTLTLPPSQYHNQIVPKSGIVLHHTVGGSAKSTYDWWMHDHKRIGTAYLVDRDGTIYEVFPPDRWAYHLGVGNTDFEKATIGIEICSEGPLVPVDDELHAYYNPKTGRGVTHEDDVIALKRKWRGYKYFDAYSTEQVIAVLGLVDLLCDRFDIPRQCPGTPWEYNPKWIGFEGVLSHSHVRADKSDIHPIQLWEPLQKYCGIIPVEDYA